MEIAFHPQPAPQKARFSVLIPTWNNLAYVQACVDSLRKHSTFSHEIILHLNDGSDGTLEWAQQEGLSFSHSPENVGVCHALNAAASLATTGYICFFNDDMVALPGWDEVLWREIESLDHDRWFLSGTMIEPTETGNACVIAPRDYGRRVEDFESERLLADYRTWPKADWSGATWPPNVVPRSLWEEVGGYSVEFSPGMSSDPDFSMKCWQAGVRYFKGLGDSRVYHFQARSTGKVTKNDGRKQFLQKWGMTQSTFGKYYLKRGELWKGPQQEPSASWGLWWGKLRSWIKKRL